LPIPLKVAFQHSPNSPDRPDIASEQSLLNGTLALSGNSWPYLAEFVLGERKEMELKPFDIINVI
jgi:hypothetical protein